MKQYQKTKVCYSEAQADGSQKYFITSETAFNVMVKKATEAKEPLPEQDAIGTFGYKAAESVDEAVTLAGGNGVGEYENIEIFLGVFNYAASLRQDNAANELLQSDNYEQQEGIIDVSFAVAQKVERAKMSPEERAIKDLAKGGIVVTPDQLRAALALIQQQAATASA
jgi:hypothetical protein